MLTPPGVGTNQPVVVGLRTGVESAPRQIWRYAGPTVEAVVPEYLFVGEAGKNVTVQGSNFGLVDSDISAVYLAAARPGGGVTQVPCAVHSVERSGSASSIECVLEHLAPANVSAGSFRMQVQVGNQISTTVGGVGIDLLGKPQVRIVQPRQGPNAGGIPIQISGQSFGNALGDVLGVSIAGYPASFSFSPDDDEIVAVLPPGAGKEVNVAVMTRGGLENDPARLFSYYTPQVLTVSPDYAFTGGPSLDFNISGEHFGHSQADIDFVSVGGSQCNSTVLVSSSQIRCYGVNASQWQDSQVVVSSGGQLSLPNSVFEVVGDPKIETVRPQTAADGESIIIFGSNFGYARDDVKNITVGGLPCGSIGFEGRTALSCTVPDKSQALLDAAAIDSRALVGLPVIIETRTGQTNPSEGNRWFAYKGGGSRPFNLPFNIAGYRTPGAHSSITLRWLYSDKVLNDSNVDDDFEVEFFEEASSFAIETSDDGGITFNSLGSQPVRQTTFQVLD